MLDFSQIATQIRSFAVESVRLTPQQQTALEEAERRLQASHSGWDETQAKILESKTSWLVAEWLEPPNSRFPTPPRPTPYTILATDGSQLVSDRHDVASCYLLNVGSIVIRYGTEERATLASRPMLAFPDDDLLDDVQGEAQVIAPRRLAIRRLLAELQDLNELTAREAERRSPPAVAPIPPDSAPSQTPPMLSLTDGSLILWPLETESETFRSESLHTFQACMDSARSLRTPIAGYISGPGSRDVVNSLRVFQCPHQKADCDHYCPHRARPKQDYVPPDCIGTERLTDADLFLACLKPGERSALFASCSKILSQIAPAHRIRFFYLHTGAEVARVEIPAWVAEDPELLDRTHALCYDQACKGDGYPVALAEAHEQAVVRGSERDAFFLLLERAFVQLRQPVSTTRKALSKRARRV